MMNNGNWEGKQLIDSIWIKHVTEYAGTPLPPRNANNNGEESQLTWSSDHGKTWSFGDWKFTSGFGYPVFLNFGKD